MRFTFWRRVTSRLFFGLFLAHFSKVALADELCLDWESRIEEDHRFEESDFTLESALESTERLAELSQTPRGHISSFAEHNNLIVLRGWLLKKAVLEAQEKKDSATSVDERLRQFCKFLVEEAVIYD